MSCRSIARRHLQICGPFWATTRRMPSCLNAIRNESVPIQLVQCRFPGLAVSSAKIYIHFSSKIKKGKGSSYSITERRVSELIAVLGSQPAGDVSHKPGGRLPLLSARPAVTAATFKRAATSFAAWRTEARWVWNSLPKTVTRQRCGCDLNPGPSAPESSMLTTRLPSQPLQNIRKQFYQTALGNCYGLKLPKCRLQFKEINSRVIYYNFRHFRSLCNEFHLHPVHTAHTRLNNSLFSRVGSAGVNWVYCILHLGLHIFSFTGTALKPK